MALEAPATIAATAGGVASTAARPGGLITWTLTPEDFAKITYRGDGPAPGRAYVARALEDRPQADRTGELTPSDIAEMSRCILDSGAGISCSPLKHALTEFTTFSRNVACANDTYMPALGSGTLTARACTEGDRAMHIELGDVWYVPACKHTLISVKALQAKGCWAIIRGNCIQYFNRQNKEMFRAVESELGYEIQWELHYPVKHAAFVEPADSMALIPAPAPTPLSEGAPAPTPVSEGVNVQMNTSMDENALLWHARLGHTAFSTLNRMVKEGHVTGINVPASQFRDASHLTCGICVQAKTACTPFKASQRQTVRPLELVHSDLCEFPVHSLGGGKYALVVIDDYSRWCVVRILKRKSDAKFELQAILNMLVTMCGEKVHTLRTDRGGEYVNSEMQEYLQEKGIIHQQSIAYAHQQNGKAERVNRSLANTVRALLLQAKFPEYMWAEAMQFACHLHNTEFKKNLQTTPQYRFLGTVPDVSTLRVFGCLVYYRVPEELRKKLDPRSRPGYYLGPEPNSKGYRVLTQGPSGQLTVKAVRDIVSIESYMIHGVPAMQSYEHRGRAQLGGGELAPSEAAHQGQLMLTGQGELAPLEAADQEQAKEWPAGEQTEVRSSQELGSLPYAQDHRGEPRGGTQCQH
jgi:transposase InsO family protein